MAELAKQEIKQIHGSSVRGTILGTNATADPSLHSLIRKWISGWNVTIYCTSINLQPVSRSSKWLDGLRLFTGK